mgnify:CR=1 FL=1
MKLFWPFIPLIAALVLLVSPPAWADMLVRILLAALALLGVLIWTRTCRRPRSTGGQRLEQQLAERTEEAHNISIALEETREALKSTQEKLTYSSRMASLGQLTAGIAHEIKNPINFVNNFAESSVEIAAELQEEMGKSEGLPEDFRERTVGLIDELVLNADKIREHGQRVNRIVQSMLVQSHGTKSEAEEVALNEFVDQYVSLAFHGMRAQVQDFNVDIDRRYDEAIDSLPIVRQDMARVLINLLNNAFQAVNKRKEVTDREFLPQVRVSTVLHEAEVEISVEDNGGGVPQSLQKKIFDPFFTTKSAGSGTGLGLSLSREIVVDGHNGQLRYEQSDLQGARFVIMLPLAGMGRGAQE